MGHRDGSFSCIGGNVPPSRIGGMPLRAIVLEVGVAKKELCKVRGSGRLEQHDRIGRGIVP